MLMPDEKGFYQCENDDFKTRNIFSYMDHAGMDFDWMVRVSPRYSFNMFTFLAELNFLLQEARYDEIWNSIQGVSLMFVNSTGDDFHEFLKEAEVLTVSEDMFAQIEQYINKEKNDN